MLPANKILEAARKTRDPRFDGRFFVGVKTTGIYCRPVCPVKLPLARNVSFYETAAAATAAGFRPCLRCRPEASPGTPAWMGSSTTVNRALRLIDEGALDDGGTLQSLSSRLGITQRHLGRLFTRYLGASPKTLVQTRRLEFAKKLIDQTQISMTEVALSAGYGSVRRFNDHFMQTYHRTPSSLRKAAPPSTEQRLLLRLGYREPYDFDGLLSFYRLRTTQGLEAVPHKAYRRACMLDGKPGRVEVTQDPHSREICCEVQGVGVRSLMQIAQRVRRMFDLDAIPEDITRLLSRDKKMARIVAQNPGQRLPGAWDGFEIAVRAILGQQVSVKSATRIMSRIAASYGTSTDYGLAFPQAEQLAQLVPEALPMPVRRARAIKTLAGMVATGSLNLESHALPHGAQEAACREQLLGIPGIGPWTADYIVMRVFGNPDAFLHGDLVLKRAAQRELHIGSEAELLARAEGWRPWRAYAGMHLWRTAAAPHLHKNPHNNSPQHPHKNSHQQRGSRR